MLIDVRSNEEFNDGHHDDAINVPVDQIAGRDFGDDLCVPMTVYCASGARAQFAKMVLEQRGFKNVELLNGTGAY